MKIIIKGIVQGVGFRPTVYKIAKSFDLNGTVRNEGSDVVIEVNDGDLLLKELMNNLPPLSFIEKIEKIDVPFDNNVNNFSIISSHDVSTQMSIPADTAICNECLNDIAEGRRKSYPFTSCTNCGPRFTLLSKLPYDRINTSMNTFPICPECSIEYESVENKRFHHQTICCDKCGPTYSLLTKNGLLIEGDPIFNFSNMLKEGKIGVIKNLGGMHICCTIENIKKIREWYGREQKPFAIMVKNLDAADRYCSASPIEQKHLTSVQKPIVLIEKKKTSITELISPGLDNIGLFLPYTGLQHMLFEHLSTDALVMTSANLPGEPMILTDKHVQELEADCYLIHNQHIENRADDSVLRMFNDNTFFIRKSRGYVPSYIETKFTGQAVALGAQENMTGAVSKSGRIYSTQHIGNGEGIGVEEYLRESINFQMSVLNCHPSIIAIDLHPNYMNRKIAKELSEKHNSQIMEVQHHWAHATSLMMENNLDNIVALTLDGTGYGDDGQAWGGEVLYSDYEKYKRLAHLEYMPLLGSEKALYDLRRLKFAIDTMNGKCNNSFTDNESSVLEKMMNKSVKCSSMGRLMDALSYTLGVCEYRTYDGEPAMKLEPLLSRGNLIPGFETSTENGIIQTVDLFNRISKTQRKEDIAYSIVYNVMKELIQNSIEYADSNDIKHIGLTGGVSYNTSVCKMFCNLVKNSEHELILPHNIPNGDGGISIGQIAVALNKVA